jgi:predicted CXXCH cytochrome family protein
MRAMGKRATRVLLLVAGSVVLGACVDEDVVFDERPIYQEIAEEAGGFLGYADPSDGEKLTFCGACHGDYQARWEGTAHADAWAGLQSSDHAEGFCEACHTVNSLGNVVAEPSPGQAVGGHAAVPDEEGRYFDVQCESCHGPGLEHVMDPADANVPLAPMEVGEDLSFGCGECHQGFHHPFVEEWEESAHGNVLPFAAENEADGCYRCHSGEGALQAFGVDSDYLGKDELLGSAHYAQITCVVCHDPHGSENAAQLRFPVNTTDPGEHLCAACHDLRAQPDTDLPQDYVITHAPAAGMMDATAGWFPPGSGLESGSATHPHGQADRLCASCHVVSYAVMNEDTGDEFFTEGHRFLAAPCVGWVGRTTEDQDCARLLPRVRALRDRLSAIDPNLSAPGGEISDGDFVFTVADGAYFNLSVVLSAQPGLPSNDEQARRKLAPAVAHNPALMAALVEASIAALDAEYGAALTAASLTSGRDSWREN